MFYADNAYIMSCIPKGEKPRQFLNNWRPITLLEVCTNVFLVVQFGLKSTLISLISETRSDFMKGRYPIYT